MKAPVKRHDCNEARPVIQLGDLARQVLDVTKVTLVGVSLASPRQTYRTARTALYTPSQATNDSYG